MHQLDKLEMGLWALHLKAQGHSGMEEFVNSAKRGLRDDHLIRMLERCEK